MTHKLGKSCMVLMVLLCAIAHGAEFFVAPTGTDSSPGTLSRPFGTIQKAARAVAENDIVTVLPGDYAGFINRRNGVVFRSSIRWGARISGGSAFRIIDNRADNVTIDGFDIVGQGRLVTASNGQFGIHNYGSHFIAKYNRVHDLRSYFCDIPAGGGGTAIALGTNGVPAVNVSAIGNILYDNGSGPACSNKRGPYGIYQAHDGILAGNIIYNHRGSGIQLWHNPSNNFVVNNLIFDNRGDGIVLGSTPGEGVSTNNVVANNAVFNNDGFGINESRYGVFGAPVNTISNNILYGNDITSVSALVESTMYINPQDFLTIGFHHKEISGLVLPFVFIDLDGNLVKGTIGPYGK